MALPDCCPMHLSRLLEVVGLMLFGIDLILIFLLRRYL